SIFTNPQDNNDTFGTLTTDAGATLTATAGTPQSANLNTAFGTPLEVTLLDGSSSPIVGAVLPFSAPSSGASATLNPLGGPTDASGQFSVMATANGIAGTYTVTAGGGMASFSLTNIPAPPPPNANGTFFTDGSNQMWELANGQFTNTNAFSELIASGVDLS